MVAKQENQRDAVIEMPKTDRDAPDHIFGKPMKYSMLALVFVALPGLVFGQEIPDMTRGVVDAHILPRFENLAQQSRVRTY